MLGARDESGWKPDHSSGFLRVMVGMYMDSGTQSREQSWVVGGQESETYRGGRNLLAEEENFPGRQHGG